MDVLWALEKSNLRTAIAVLIARASMELNFVFLPGLNLEITGGVPRVSIKTQDLQPARNLTRQSSVLTVEGDLKSLTEGENEKKPDKEGCSCQEQNPL